MNFQERGSHCYTPVAGCNLLPLLPIFCFRFLISGNGSPLGASSALSFLAAENKAQEAKNTVFSWASTRELPGQDADLEACVSDGRNEKTSVSSRLPVAWSKLCPCPSNSFLFP